MESRNIREPHKKYPVDGLIISLSSTKLMEKTSIFYKLGTIVNTSPSQRKVKFTICLTLPFQRLTQNKKFIVRYNLFQNA